ncbi:MAG TPA: response regulator transcription factor [Aggregatilineaceae bacterium]|nr:response regulator transcription factor [Aggregatilineaceae bacterium]
MDRISILAADDHPLFRDGLRLLLNSESDMDLIGEASTGEQAVELAAMLQPDLVLMDIKMPGLNGIEATRRIVSASPHIAVLILTMYEDDDSVLAAMRAGARGYVLKGERQEAILGAIRAVSSGDAIFGAPIAQRLLGYLSTPRTKAASDVFPELTEREVEILNLIAAGYNNTEIAERLVVSPKTVRNHVSNVFRKLEVADRAQAIIRARESGLGTDSI